MISVLCSERSRYPPFFGAEKINFFVCWAPVSVRSDEVSLKPLGAERKMWNYTEEQHHLICFFWGLRLLLLMFPCSCAADSLWRDFTAQGGGCVKAMTSTSTFQVRNKVNGPLVNVFRTRANVRSVVFDVSQRSGKATAAQFILRPLEQLCILWNRKRWLTAEPRMSVVIVSTPHFLT